MGKGASRKWPVVDDQLEAWRTKFTEDGKGRDLFIGKHDK